MKNVNTCDTTIWDDGLYRFFYYLRHASNALLLYYFYFFFFEFMILAILVFYTMLAYSSLRISSPEYYKAEKWLKK